MIHTLRYFKTLILTFGFLNVWILADAQTIRQTPSISRVGFTAGALTYTGRYSVNTPLFDHTSWGASVFYVPNIQVHKNLSFKAELMGGQLRGDNTSLEASTGAIGSFSTNILELSLKGEYDFVDLRVPKYRFSPYVSAGPGFYRLFNYTSSMGDKPSSDLMGFVLPIGGGLKYKASPRLNLVLDGAARIFNRNLDNYDPGNANNPNFYFTVGLGISYKLLPADLYW